LYSFIVCCIEFFVGIENNSKPRAIPKIVIIIIAGKYQSKRSKSVLSNFLQRRGYKSIRILKQKDNVLNLSRIKNLAENRNLILEEYKLRNKETYNNTLNLDDDSFTKNAKDENGENINDKLKKFFNDESSMMSNVQIAKIQK